ncbi:MAG: M4 family metallopeptidase [Myxococcota bacterium]
MLKNTEARVSSLLNSYHAPREREGQKNRLPRAILGAFLLPCLFLSLHSADAHPLVMSQPDFDSEGLSSGAQYQPLRFQRMETRSGLRASELPPLLALAQQEVYQRLPEKVGTSGGLELLRAVKDDRGGVHIRMAQTWQQIPVYNGEVIVHVLPDGTRPLTDALVMPLHIQAKVELSAAEALELALLERPEEERIAELPQIQPVYFPVAEGLRLAWHVQLFQEEHGYERQPVQVIDALDGQVLLQYDNLQTVQGSGKSAYSGTVAVEAYYKSSTYYMEDLVRKVGTFDLRNGTSSVYRYTDSNNVWDSTTHKSGVDAGYGARQYLDFLKNTYTRNGLDGANGPGYYTAMDGTTKVLSLMARYGSKYNNAYWNGYYVVLGDGDGTTFGNLTSVDIVSHELTHGLVQFTANLGYTGESGAINEGLADVFGTLAEIYTYGASSSKSDYMIGEDVYTPSTSGDALRYMDNPHKAANYGFTADDDPCHYSERYTGTSDNGGVHINSGILNRAFYLLSKGGSQHTGGSMTGIGADKAGRIFYDAMTAWLTSGASFASTANATVSAAKARYGSSSTEAKATAQAWSLVGVTTTARVQ